MPGPTVDREMRHVGVNRYDRHEYHQNRDFSPHAVRIAGPVCPGLNSPVCTSLSVNSGRSSTRILTLIAKSSPILA